MILKNNFDGGTNGVGMTAGNTGGTSGDAFTAVESSAVFSNEWANSGALSMKLPSAAATGYGRWATSADKNAALRAYAWMTAGHTGDFFLERLEVAGANAANVLISPASHLRLRVGATNVWTATDQFPLSQVVRLEVLFEIGTTASGGRARIAYYLGDSLTPIEDSGWLTGVALAGETGAISSVRFGKSSAGAYAGAAYMDDIAVATGADYTGNFIGPATVPATPSPVVLYDGTGFVDLDVYTYDGAVFVPVEAP